MTASFKGIPIIYSPHLLDHDPGPDHPERPERVSTILKGLEAGPLADAIQLIEPKAAPLEWIRQVHDGHYLLRFEEQVMKGRSFLDHPDNRLSWYIYDQAILSAGTGITAIDLLEGDGHDHSAPPFCLTRPPGHHADPRHALGFCFLNNVAIAVRYWQVRYGRQRIAIFDFDAHHGNGIQDVFYSDPDVLYISIHENPLLSFPGTGFCQETGQGPGEGTTINIPLEGGGTPKEVADLLTERIGPALEEFGPDALVAAAGFDAHLLDDMSGLAFSTRTYGLIGTHLRAWADLMCQGRLVSILEGGYNLDVLAGSVEIYLGALAVETG